jgi:eukaryotic-like serine/threonine-protein kinase
MCDSLEDAHHAGLVHRDIKPANVYTCRRGRKRDFIKVLDFGLVKPAWTAQDQERSLTGQGVIAGTPAYLAPELALGSRDVDGRADIYALGCVAYWLVTGERVFEAESPLQVVVQHIQAAPVPPSRRAGTAVPPDLEELILRCLQKAPEDRPADAAEVARHLASCRLDARWTPERAAAWWDENVGPPD